MNQPSGRHGGLTSVFLIFISTVPALAAITNIRVAGRSSTQILLAYEVADNRPCTLEVSLQNSYAPLVHDVNPALFPGADSDFRPENVRTISGSRIFVIGKHGMMSYADRNPFLAVNGRRYSRALKANTQHYYRISCPADGVATGTFETANVSLGNTYPENLPIDPSDPGKYNWPDVDWTNRQEPFIDPYTGVYLRKISLPNDYVQYDGSVVTHSIWANGSGGETCSPVENHESTGNYYLCWITHPTAMLYSLNSTTGEIFSLGPINGVGPMQIVFDGKHPRRFYGMLKSPQDQRFHLYQGEWTGALDQHFTGLSTDQANPRIRWTDLTADLDIREKIAAFNPLYSAAERANQSCELAERIAVDKLAIRCSSGQESMSWAAVFDPGPRRIVAAMSVARAPGTRWCGMHAQWSADPNESWTFFSPHRILDSADRYGFGPYVVKVAGPGNGSISPSDTVFTILPTFGRYEPLHRSQIQGTPVPGESSDGYLMDAQPGDLFTFDPSATSEFLELVSKTPLGNGGWQWTMRRGQNLRQSPFVPPGSEFRPDEQMSLAQAHPAGSWMYAACRSTALNKRYESSEAYWNFAKDPYGTQISHPPLDPAVSPQIINYRTTGSHNTIGAASTVAAYWGCGQLGGFWNLGWGSQAGAIPASLNQPYCSKAARAIPAFHGAKPLIQGVDIHPMFMQRSAPAWEQQWITDLMVLENGENVNPWSAVSTRIATNLYKVAGPVLNRPTIPTLASCGERILRDISGPALGDTITSLTPYTYCVANQAGECRQGSTIGDIYANCPAANYPSEDTVHCYKGSLPNSNTVDLCLGDLSAYIQSAVQVGMAYESPQGEWTRVLARLFQRYHAVGATFDAVRPSSNGKFAFMPVHFSPSASFPNGLHQALLVELPPFPNAGADALRRDRLISSRISIDTDVGVPFDNVVAEFGYAENGDLSQNEFYCTSRKEACVKGSQPGLEFGFLTQNVPGLFCHSSCEMTLPLIPERMLYYRIHYRLGNTLALTGPKRIIGDTARSSLEKQAPAAPSGLRLDVARTFSSLRWDPNRESNLLGYYVYESAAAQGPYRLLNITPLAETRYDDNVITVGSAEWYKVSAVNSDGIESALSDPVGTHGGAPSLRFNPLASMRVYPNPYRRDKHKGTIVFDKIVAGTRLKIFTTSGHLVKEWVSHSTQSEWNLKNSVDQLAASGVYLFLAQDEAGNKATGKFALIK